MAPISTSHIVYLQAFKNYTLFVMSNGTEKLSTTTLGKHEAYLDEALFVRIHRQYLINRIFVERVELDNKSGWVQLKNGKRFQVARRRIQEVLRHFSN